jgi:GT2 family glycosyltransferase
MRRDPEALLTGVSVVIVNYNGRQHLKDLLDSLARQDCPADEMIVVDNASTDGSVEYLQESFPWVHVIALHDNVGFAEGNNIGVAKARGEYIALLNNDTVVDHQWLSELVRTLESDDRIGAVVPKIYKASSYPRLDCTGAEFNNLGFAWGRGANQIDRGQFERVEEVPALTGCSVLLRRAALGDDPVFDASYFMYYEELDLSLRVRGRGYSIVYVPTAVVQHKVSKGVSQVARKPVLFQQFYANRNRVKILVKYYPVSILVRSLPLTLLSLVYWNTYFLRHGGPRFAARALLHQLQFAREGLKERRHTRGIRAQRWVPWMKHHRIRDLRRLRATFAEG